MKPFEGLLGNNCELRMLEYFLPLEGMDFNITELSEEVGVSRVTATRIAKKFVEWEILNSKKRSGIAYYSINQESPIVKNIEQLNNILIENILGDEILYEIYDHWEAQKPHVQIDGEKSNVSDVLPLQKDAWHEIISRGVCVQQQPSPGWPHSPVGVSAEAFRGKPYQNFGGNI